MVSWYPPGLADDNGEPTEDLVPAVLDAAYRHNLKVRRHQRFYTVCETACAGEEGESDASGPLRQGTERRGKRPGL